ncbi:MAG: hypothetical protein Q4D33_12645 [Prevotellaceae bacterium]|nr:hypothetical protein [Prevotellaceae bacterium]
MEKKVSELKINKALENAMPPLQEMELNLLSRSLMEEGCRDPLVTWDGVIVDMIGGMTRFLKMYRVRANSFVKALREVTQAEVVHEAMRFGGMTKNGAYAAALAEIYDRNAVRPLVEKN